MTGRKGLARFSLALAFAIGLAPDAPAQQQVDCTGGYMAETKSLDAQHKAEAQGCRGNGQCINQANAKKAAGLKAAGQKKYQCEQLKAQTPKMDTLPPTRTWSQAGPNAVYTDEKGQRWSFPNTIQEGPMRYTLDRATLRIEQAQNLRSVIAYYREAQNRMQPKLVNGRPAGP